MTRGSALAAAIACALATAGACGGSSDEAAQQPPPSPGSSAKAKMTPEEARTGRDACNAYVERVCACATKVTTFAQECRDAPKLVDSLTLMLDVAAHAEQRRDALQVLANVRRTIKRCVERTGELPSQGCS